MTHDEKELYAAMMVYYLMRGTIDRHEHAFGDYITNWGAQSEGVRRGIQANLDQTVSAL